MHATQKIKLVECPRDAMQGLDQFIPTAVKIEYLNLLLQAGFDTLDFGSFVSPKAVPQMADTVAVLQGLKLSSSNTKLLAIVANLKGIEEASVYPEISYLGYPFSISEIFQQRNTNTSISSSLATVENLAESCSRNNKTMVLYLSMAFGNPYGEDWSEEIAVGWTEELIKRGATTIALSDTIGAASPENVASLYLRLSSSYPKVEFGVHLHSTPDNWEAKIEAAYQSGCRSFDSAIKGFGGCPMATDKLTGNIATENILSFLQAKNEPLSVDLTKFQKAFDYSARVFSSL